jgi:hypothetical protein
MSRKSVIERQKRRLIKFEKYSKLRKFLSGKIKASNLVEEKLFYSSLIQRLPKDSFKSRSLCLIYYTIYILNFLKKL